MAKTVWGEEEQLVIDVFVSIAQKTNDWEQFFLVQKGNTVIAKSIAST